MTASTSGDGIVNPSGAPVLLVGLVFCKTKEVIRICKPKKYSEDVNQRSNQKM
jgi:hypothetical protein